MWQTAGKGLGQVGQGKLRRALRSKREVGLRILSRGEPVVGGRGDTSQDSIHPDSGDRQA